MGTRQSPQEQKVWSLPSLNARGFKLLIEVLAKAGGDVVKEVPILFVNRRYGKSKLTAGEA